MLAAGVWGLALRVADAGVLAAFWLEQGRRKTFLRFSCRRTRLWWLGLEIKFLKCERCVNLGAVLFPWRWGYKKSASSELWSRMCAEASESLAGRAVTPSRFCCRFGAGRSLCCRSVVCRAPQRSCVLSCPTGRTPSRWHAC